MIAYRIVAVPERGQEARALATRVGADIIMDFEHKGAFENHLAALQSAPGADHVVVLEDDAIVCGDFHDHVARLVAERPEHLIGLYVGRERPRIPQPVLARLADAAPPWLDHARVTDALKWGVGYVMPGRDIDAVSAEARAGGAQPYLNVDVRIGRWHAARGRVSYPFPSPVDHNDTLPSTGSRHGRGRVAWAHCTGGAQ